LLVEFFDAAMDDAAAGRVAVSRSAGGAGMRSAAALVGDVAGGLVGARNFDSSTERSAVVTSSWVSCAAGLELAWLAAGVPAAAGELDRSAQTLSPTITNTTTARADARSSHTDCPRHSGCRARDLTIDALNGGGVKGGGVNGAGVNGAGVNGDGVKGARIGSLATSSVLGVSEKKMSSAPDSAGTAVTDIARQCWYTD
jgi:hypothetical protein